MNRPTENEIRLVWRILSWIGMIEQLSNARASRALAAIDLPFSQFVILNHFSWRPDEAKTVTSIASALQQPQPGITKTVQKLIARRFLRARPSARDGRSKELFVAPKGIEIHRKAIQTLVPVYSDLFEPWTEGEMEDLLAKLDRLKVWLDTKGRE
jgi:DNA-binding MarR family transcriptional regulator